MNKSWCIHCFRLRWIMPFTLGTDPENSVTFGLIASIWCFNKQNLSISEFKIATLLTRENRAGFGTHFSQPRVHVKQYVGHHAAKVHFAKQCIVFHSSKTMFEMHLHLTLHVHTKCINASYIDRQKICNLRTTKVTNLTANNTPARHSSGRFNFLPIFSTFTTCASRSNKQSAFSGWGTTLARCR